MTKMTKKDYFNALLTIEAVANNPELTGFINHELELLAKKNKSVAKKSNANDPIKAMIEKVLGDKKARTVTEICTELENKYSNQKITALLKQMVDDEKVIKTVEKKKSYFSINA